MLLRLLYFLNLTKIKFRYTRYIIYGTILIYGIMPKVEKSKEDKLKNAWNLLIKVS